MKQIENLTLRRALQSDAASLIGVIYDTFGSTWEPNITAAASEAFKGERRPELYFATRGLLFWVADIKGKAIGFVDWDGDFINALHVHSDYARNGIGTALMDKAEAEIARAGFRAARLETDTFNVKSQSFYFARGYQEAGRYPDLEWNSELTTLLLMKQL